MSPCGERQKANKHKRRKKRYISKSLDPEIRKRFGAWVTTQRSKVNLPQKSFGKPSEKTMQYVEAGERLTRTTFVKILDRLNEEGKSLGVYVGSWEEVKRGEFPRLNKAVHLSPPERQLFSDYLTGLAFAEWRGTPEQWDYALHSATERLQQKPGDLYLRAMILWSVLLKGKPGEVLAAVQEIAKFLATDSRWRDNANFESAWRKKLDEMKRGRVEAPRYVQRHLEDTVARALLLRWLKREGSSSHLAQRIKGIASGAGIPFEVKSIFASEKVQTERDWLGGAIEEVQAWISREQDYGLAQLFLLYLIGRWDARERTSDVLEQACRWIEQHPQANDSLVRWGTLWIAGILGDQHVEQVFGQTGPWLNTAASEDDRLVRTTHLWLAGCRGDKDHVHSAIGDTRKWLNRPAHREDDCVRAAYLLWLIRRAQRRGMVTPKQLAGAIHEMRDWPKNRDDQLVQLAWTLAESPVECD